MATHGNQNPWRLLLSTGFTNSFVFTWLSRLPDQVLPTMWSALLVSSLSKAVLASLQGPYGCCLHKAASLVDFTFFVFSHFHEFTRDVACKDILLFSVFVIFLLSLNPHF